MSMDILKFIYISIYIYCDHSFPVHTNLEIQVPT